MTLPPDPKDGRISQDQLVTPELTDLVPMIRPGNVRPRRNVKATVTALLDLVAGQDVTLNHMARYGFYGIGEAVAVDVVDDLYIPMLCRIERVTVLCDQATTAELDVWVAPFADYPPTIADTICGGNTLSLTAADTLQSTALVDWTRQIPAGSVVRVAVASNDLAERIVVQLDLVEVIE